MKHLVNPLRWLPFAPAAALAVLALPSVPLIAATLQGPPPKPAPSADKAKQRELLDQAFHSLEQELVAAIQDYQVALSAANAQKLPREQWPKPPNVEFYARFEQLALHDQPDSLRWCIGSVDSIGFGMDEAIARKIVLYERMIKAHASSRWSADITSFLANEGRPEGIGIDRAVPFLDEIAKAAVSLDVRSKALYAKSQLYSKSAKPEHAPLAAKALRELIETCPGTPETRRAKGLLFQTEHLRVGGTPPDVETVDPDGRPFKLSDFRGKVTAVVFWGFWCAPCRAMLPHEKELVARLKDKPFALIGVNTDTDKEAFQRQAKEMGITWKISWQGGQQGPWAQAWGVSKFPTVYVLDEKGQVRAIDVRGEALSKVVDDLLAELEAKSRSGGPIPK